MTDGDFRHYYARRLRTLDVAYDATDYLSPHQPPWPEQSFDHPFGQAPTVANIPATEQADWDQYVAQYYTDNVLGTPSHPTPFGVQSAEFARRRFEENGISGYATVDDAAFVELLCEGLYSKFLCPLDEVDEQLFGVRSDERYQYLKSDFSCMKLVRKTWPGEFIAPAIAVVRRQLPITDDTRWKYELVGIALAKRDASDKYVFSKDLLFDPVRHKSQSAWWLAKFYVLQGAIHRINLIDHIRVHFPSDTINAVTKSVLPQWHVVQQLLLPHFWLTLPVNHAVLEGARSLINRDTWYPWSPVVANGDEIRRLIPLSWGGSDYCWDGPANSAYPQFYFSLEPGSAPDPSDPKRSLPNYIGLKASRFGAFQEDYFEPILNFARGVIDTLPEPAANREQDDVLWLEIQRWAYEISRLVPGFPDEHAIRNKATLARTCASIIWNASIVHSSDHCALHVMIDTAPVPFMLRVPPPATNSTDAEITIGEALGEKGMAYLKGGLVALENALLPANGPGNEFVRKALEGALATLAQVKLTEGSAPLCWPTDLISTKMADLLFYRPHGSSLLYDCQYAFLREPLEPIARATLAPLEPAWRSRTRIDYAQRNALRDRRDTFQRELQQVNARYYDEAGKPVQYGTAKVYDFPCVLNQYGFPKLIPGSADDNVAATRMECCFSAGIQY